MPPPTPNKENCNKMKDTTKNYLNQNRDHKGRFIPSRNHKKGRASELSAQPNYTDDVVNLVAYVLDRSGSMSRIYKKAIEIINEQIVGFNTAAHNQGQLNFITCINFDDKVDVIQNNELSKFYRLPAWDGRVGGCTALADAVSKAASLLLERGAELEARGAKVAYLVNVLTDGLENASGVDPRYLSRMPVNDPKWTFGFMGPKGCTSHLMGLGVPKGNIVEWEQTEESLNTVVRQSTQHATTNYVATRSEGKTKTESLYLDLSNIKGNAFTKGANVAKEFQQWKVEKESSIEDFVNGKLTNKTVQSRVGGSSYELGRGFYLLTKKEVVQPHKNILIQDKDTGIIISNQDTRAMLGFTNSSINYSVDPYNLGKYNVFIQSTSPNRKLVRGSVMLYKKFKKSRSA